jgi:ubiquinone/menaquinone biosynthesis C-methylase UbiE
MVMSLALRRMVRRRKMTPRLQRRVQRYGWDKAVTAYEQGWRAQLEPAHCLMLDMVALQPGDRVLDVACGTGLVSLCVAEVVGAAGAVVGTDVSGQMVEAARLIAAEREVGNATFERGEAAALPFADGSFDAAICGLGLM